MADAKEKADWNQTSHLIAMVHNVQVSGDNHLDPNDFNPFVNTEREELEYLPPKETNDILKAALGIE